jgi:hypothetical protein
MSMHFPGESIALGDLLVRLRTVEERERIGRDVLPERIASDPHYQLPAEYDFDPAIRRIQLERVEGYAAFLAFCRQSAAPSGSTVVEALIQEVAKEIHHHFPGRDLLFANDYSLREQRKVAEHLNLDDVLSPDGSRVPLNAVMDPFRGSFDQGVKEAQDILATGGPQAVELLREVLPEVSASEDETSKADTLQSEAFHPLNGWAEILAAMNEPNGTTVWKNDETTRDRIRKLNKETNGPIRLPLGRGKRPSVEKNELMNWLAKQKDRFIGSSEEREAADQSENLTIAESHAYGASGTVVPGINGSIRKRRAAPIQNDRGRKRSEKIGK